MIYLLEFYMHFKGDPSLINTGPDSESARADWLAQSQVLPLPPPLEFDQSLIYWHNINILSIDYHIINYYHIYSYFISTYLDILYYYDRFLFIYFNLLSKTDLRNLQIILIGQIAVDCIVQHSFSFLWIGIVTAWILGNACVRPARAEVGISEPDFTGHLVGLDSNACCACWRDVRKEHKPPWNKT